MDSISDDVRNATEDTVARLERLPFGRVHLRAATLLGVGTFFDAFDSLVIASVLTVVVTTFGVGFGSTGILISSAYVGQFIGAISPSMQVAPLFNPFIILVLGTFCGVTITYPTLPNYWHWLYQLTPYTRLMSAMISTELQ